MNVTYKLVWGQMVRLHGATHNHIIHKHNSCSHKKLRGVCNFLVPFQVHTKCADPNKQFSSWRIKALTIMNIDYRPACKGHSQTPTKHLLKWSWQKWPCFLIPTPLKMHHSHAKSDFLPGTSCSQAQVTLTQSTFSGLSPINIPQKTWFWHGVVVHPEMK